MPEKERCGEQNQDKLQINFAEAHKEYGESQITAGGAGFTPQTNSLTEIETQEVCCYKKENDTSKCVYFVGIQHLIMFEYIG